MWQAIFNALQAPITGDSSFVIFLKNCLTSIISLFVTVDTSGTTPVYSVTDFGVIFFAVVAIGVLYGLMSWVIKLMKLRG